MQPRIQSIIREESVNDSKLYLAEMSDIHDTEPRSSDQDVFQLEDYNPFEIVEVQSQREDFES